MPDSTILLDYMLNQMSDIIEHLVIYPENMKANLDKTGGLIFSQRVLIELVKQGLTREKAYRIVQKNAMLSWKDKRSFQKLLLEDKEVTTALKPYMINKCFELEYYLRNVKKIFKRTGLV